MAVAVGHTMNVAPPTRQLLAAHQVYMPHNWCVDCCTYIHCVSYPGTGEYIIKTLLARECAVYGYNNCCIDINFTDAAPSIYSTRVVQLQRETFTQP